VFSNSLEGENLKSIDWGGGCSDNVPVLRGVAFGEPLFLVLLLLVVDHLGEVFFFFFFLYF
jgi:hypothetical protein